MHAFTSVSRPVVLVVSTASGQYKCVAAEHEIIVPGVPSKTKPNDMKSKVVENV